MRKYISLLLATALLCILMVPAMASGNGFFNNGMLTNHPSGEVNNIGTFENTGTITNNGPFSNTGVLTGQGVLTGSAAVTGSGSDTTATPSGVCGTSTTWALSQDGSTLTISGTGAMMDYPAGSTTPWENWYRTITSVVVESGVTSIGDYAFFNMNYLTTVSLPVSITIIGASAFSSCYSLTSITIPANVTTIYDYAFAFCPALTSIEIPNKVAKIGCGAFVGCTNLTEITVAGGNSNYLSEGGVLYDSSKTSLLSYPANKAGESFSIPNSVTTIGDYAFSFAQNLTTVSIPASVTSFGSHPFDSNGSIKNITYDGTFSQLYSAASGSLPGGVAFTCSDGAYTSVVGEVNDFSDTGITLDGTVYTYTDGFDSSAKIAAKDFTAVLFLNLEGKIVNYTSYAGSDYELSENGKDGKNDFNIIFPETGNPPSFRFVAPDDTPADSTFFVQFRNSSATDSMWFAYNNVNSGSGSFIDFSAGVYTTARIYAWNNVSGIPTGDYLANFAINLTVEETDNSFEFPGLAGITVSRGTADANGRYRYFVQGDNLDFDMYQYWVVGERAPVFASSKTSGMFYSSSNLGSIAMYAQSGEKSGNSYTVKQSKTCTVDTIGEVARGSSNGYSLTFTLDRTNRNLTFKVTSPTTDDQVYEITLYGSDGNIGFGHTADVDVNFADVFVSYFSGTYDLASLNRFNEDSRVHVAEFLLSPKVTVINNAEAFPVATGVSVEKVASTDPSNDPAAYKYIVSGLGSAPTSGSFTYAILYNDAPHSLDASYTAWIPEDIGNTCALVACYGDMDANGDFVLKWTSPLTDVPVTVS